MTEIILCPECGTPQDIIQSTLWLNSGVMVQSTNLSRRVGFIESQNMEPLYAGIGKIIGMPIDHLVIDIARRGAADYFGNLIRPEIRHMIRSNELEPGVMGDFLVTMGLINGFGKYELLKQRYRGAPDDYTIMRVIEPFSPLLCAGAQAGALEVVSGIPHRVTAKEISPGVYEISAYASEHGDKLAERMPIPLYHHRDGDIELAKCATCGGPTALSGFKWHLDRGVIVNNLTGRRMVMIGPEMQDPLFEELEKELGETVPRAVVEAQRLFIKSGSYSIDEISDERVFRTQLALRGMGNLREIKMDDSGMRMRIDNAANRLMIVGMVQGLFEKALDVESSVDWEVSEGGDLEVEVIPKL